MAGLRAISAIAVVTATLAMTSCTVSTGSRAPLEPGTDLPGPSHLPPASTPWPSPPADSVLARGLVVDRLGEVRLCLGVERSANPMTCDGPVIDDWDWDAVTGPRSAFGVRYGGFAFPARYDGAALAVVDAPVALGLLDPSVRWDDPTDGVPGSATDASLRRIETEIEPWFGDTMLGSHVENGRLWVDVVWDDGTWQRRADETYGTAAVVIRPALLELPGFG